jgi:hypothetical protein
MWILEQLGFSSSFSVYIQIEWLNLDRVQLGSMINGMQGRGMPAACRINSVNVLRPCDLVRVLAPGRQLVRLIRVLAPGRQRG